MKMHKAIFGDPVQGRRADYQRKNPGFKLDKRNLLHHIDYEKGTIELDGKEYKMLDSNFPTIDPKSHMHLPKKKRILWSVWNGHLKTVKITEPYAFPVEQRRII